MRRALLIGIDRYPLYPPFAQLRGCTNDARALAALLTERFAFPAEQVTLLLDEQATRDAILAALGALAASTGAGDAVFLHYSGHGSQVADREGDEADGRDETIVPHDSGPDAANWREITDDELGLWLATISERTPHVTVVLDCCHAGTGLRDPLAPAVRRLPPSTLTLAELPPSPLPATRGASTPHADRYVLLAACRDSELAAEHVVTQGEQTLYHGLLSFCLLGTLATTPAGTTYRELFEQLSMQVAALGYGQHPEIEGAAHQPLFGGASVPATPFVLVAKRAIDAVVLAGGAATGLAAGSQWAVYEAGSRAPAGQPMGLLEVVSVGVAQSRARLLSEQAAGAIATGCRAFEMAHDYGDSRLAVAVSPQAGYEAQGDEVAKLIAAAPLLRLAAAGEDAPAVVYLLGPRAQALPGDPLPSAGPLAKPTGLALYQGQQLAAYLLADSAAPAGLVATLLTAARYRNTLALRNTDPQSGLAGKLALTLLRRGAGGSWHEPQATSLPAFGDGEYLAIMISSSALQPLFVTLLVFGYDQSIAQLYPPLGATVQIAPGQQILIGGAPPHDAVQLFLDPQRPPAQGGALECYKLIATTSPTDLSPLLQESPRALPGTTPIERLLSTALTGSRLARISYPPPSDDWTTVERLYLIHPAS